MVVSVSIVRGGSSRTSDSNLGSILIFRVVVVVVVVVLFFFLRLG